MPNPKDNSVSVVDIIVIGSLVVGIILMVAAKDFAIGGALTGFAVLAYSFGKASKTTVRNRVEPLPTRREEPHTHERVRAIVMEGEDASRNEAQASAQVAIEESQFGQQQQTQARQRQASRAGSIVDAAHRAMQMHDSRVDAGVVPPITEAPVNQDLARSSIDEALQQLRATQDNLATRRISAMSGLDDLYVGFEAHFFSVPGFLPDSTLPSYDDVLIARAAEGLPNYDYNIAAEQDSRIPELDLSPDDIVEEQEELVQRRFLPPIYSVDVDSGAPRRRLAAPSRTASAVSTEEREDETVASYV